MFTPYSLLFISTAFVVVSRVSCLGDVSVVCFKNVIAESLVHGSCYKFAIHSCLTVKYSNTEDPHYNDSVCYRRFCCKIEFAIIKKLDMGTSRA